MEILIPITFFIMIGAIVLVPQYLRTQERMRTRALLKAAIEAGQQLTPEMINALSIPKEGGFRLTADASLLIGLLLLASAIGSFCLSRVLNVDALMGASAMPACLGLAFLGMFFYLRKKTA